MVAGDGGSQAHMASEVINNEERTDPCLGPTVVDEAGAPTGDNGNFTMCLF